MTSNIIGSFPVALPGELFYSICARYKLLMGLSDRKVRSQLFGSAEGAQSWQFPRCLDFFEKKALWTKLYTAEKVIHENSLYSVYAPFVSEERRLKLKDLLLGNGRNSVGILIGKVEMVKILRFCPVCSLAEKRRFGFSYWHQLHQIPSVLVCPQHKVFLEDSQNTLQNHWLRTQNHFHLADDFTSNTASRNNTGPISNYLETIANDFQWLLDNPYSKWNIHQIALGYIDLLRAKGLTYKHRQTVRRQDLVYELKNFYPEELLSVLKSELVDAENNWLFNFFRHARTIMEPVRHILLLRYIGLGVGAFHEYLAAEANPSNQFISRPNSENSSKNVANGKAKHFISAKKLKSWWSNRSISLAEISKRLHKNPTQIYLLLEQMGISPSRFGEDERFSEESRLRYRNQWLYLLKSEPTLDLRVHYRSLFRRVYYFDHDWFIKHKPLNKMERAANKGNELFRLDKEIASLIPSIVQDLQEHQGPRPRITQKVILKKLYDLKVYKLDTIYPETKKALREHVELRENYAVLRIRWTIEKFRAKHIAVNKKTLIWSLKLSWAENNEKVMHALDKLIEQ